MNEMIKQTKPHWLRTCYKQECVYCGLPIAETSAAGES